MKLINAIFSVLFLFPLFQVLANEFPLLPEPVTNNAVATVTIDDVQYIVSFMGLAAGKSYKDVHNKTWKMTVDKAGQYSPWQQVRSVPGSLKLKGRLASIAIGVDDKIYLFGGYTVASNHTEQSAPDVYSYDVLTDHYNLLPPMPVPVDDAIALSYRNRYIYLVSGWHNDGNVNLVQMYDIVKNEWRQASPFLGAPVFGHAGGIVDNQLMVCDGVKTVAHMTRRRSFAQQTACYLGEIDVMNPAQINWYEWVHPTDEGRYRMAAAGDIENDRIIFVGGATNPYNFDGIGYDKIPSEPTSEIWSYYLSTRTWKVTESKETTMDHRGLINVGDKWITVGGMGNKQIVLDQVKTHIQ
ncbi:galactose oxidase [Psychrosphaera sp. B3R10]|uniref:Kelch repeat-containing protein n=1 Tax=unclassified Psychrosphaera TaxID=2641570 RepID=UPI001C0A4BE4|nr:MULTISPECIES: galactose oxidase [unclassified Psychrosphaera]MBU2881138.1 galactose oxidase [Psychrosphaera sp. I2R16]MBU2988243.1 galactose oxidase [Psychrosphaera sp. B3R10]